MGEDWTHVDDKRGGLFVSPFTFLNFPKMNNLNIIISQIYLNHYRHQLDFLKIDHEFLKEKITVICDRFSDSEGIAGEFKVLGINITDLDLSQTIYLLCSWICELKPIRLKKEYPGSEVAKYINEYLALFVARGIYYNEYDYLPLLSKASVKNLINVFKYGKKQEILSSIYKNFKPWD